MRNQKNNKLQLQLKSFIGSKTLAKGSVTTGFSLALFQQGLGVMLESLLLFFTFCTCYPTSFLLLLAGKLIPLLLAGTLMWATIFSNTNKKRLKNGEQNFRNRKEVKNCLWNIFFKKKLGCYECGIKMLSGLKLLKMLIIILN